VSIIAALSPQGAGGDARLISELKEQFPDG
jgi:hypothetical protein